MCLPRPDRIYNLNFHLHNSHWDRHSSLSSRRCIPHWAKQFLPERPRHVYRKWRKLTWRKTQNDAVLSRSKFWLIKSSIHAQCPGYLPKIATPKQQQSQRHFIIKVFCTVLKTAPFSVNSSKIKSKLVKWPGMLPTSHSVQINTWKVPPPRPILVFVSNISVRVRNSITRRTEDYY